MWLTEPSVRPWKPPPAYPAPPRRGGRARAEDLEAYLGDLEEELAQVRQELAALRQEGGEQR